jgi:DNA-binding FadR family transcriptional regulator
MDRGLDSPVTLAGSGQLYAAEFVAEQLRRHVALRLVPSGGRLPSERELATIFGVGRATVQEGIGLLQKERLVERRRGRTGGTFVVAPRDSRQSLSRVLKEVSANRRAVEEALDYRLELEPAACARAAGARNDDDLSRLSEALHAAQRAKDDATFMRYDVEFHLAVAGATHNRFFVEGVERVRMLLNPALALLPESDLWHQRSHREHRAVLSALRAGHREQARAAMLRHVAHTDRSVRALLRAF